MVVFDLHGARVTVVEVEPPEASSAPVFEKTPSLPVAERPDHDESIGWYM